MFNLCCDCLEGGVTRICPAFVCDVASLEASNVRAHTFSHTDSITQLYTAHTCIHASYTHAYITDSNPQHQTILLEAIQIPAGGSIIKQPAVIAATLLHCYSCGIAFTSLYFSRTGLYWLYCVTVTVGCRWIMFCQNWAHAVTVTVTASE